MRIGDAQKGLFFFNVFLFIGLGGVAANMTFQKSPDMKAPEERPAIRAEPVQKMTPPKFRREYGVCWNWVPEPVKIREPVRVTQTEVLPKELPIEITELNSAGSEKLRHIVFEYTGASPGNGNEGVGQQKVHQFVYSAKPFLLSDGRMVKLVSVVKEKGRSGAWFEVNGKEKRFVKYSPISSGREEANGGGDSGKGSGRRGPMHRSNSSSQTNSPGSLTGKRKPLDVQTRKLAPDRWQIGRADWEDAYENRQQYISEVKLVVLMKSGEMLGLELKEAGPSTLAYSYGFRDKDIVRKIMGQPVTSVDDFYRIMEENSTASSAVIEIERSGRRMQIQFQFSP
jgi:hypothetical protein